MLTEAFRTVVKGVTDRLAACGRIGLNLGTSRTELDKLDAAVLAKACCGELVPQDPGDEPASALLARLASERDTPAPSASPAPARRSNRAASKPRA